ncbi:Hypothetical predicted protein [Pelobates cultripes]|uniref:Uncharacterized protein n=1 Tax=Pelobates cultripes TaxID=61616 RepID=A0AAD1RSE8_PELCU|nr:Hypothetical predicted protein [Pelobates cultripes]
MRITPDSPNIPVAMSFREFPTQLHDETGTTYHGDVTDINLQHREYLCTTLTKEINSTNASVAEVIPLIAALKRLLGKEVQTDHGVKIAKSTLLEAVKRFQDTESNPLYSNATVRDPQFKEHYFDVEKKHCAWEIIQAQLKVMEASGERDLMHSTEQSVPEKRSRRTSDKEHIPLLSDMFDEILQESSTPIHNKCSYKTDFSLNYPSPEVTIPLTTGA